ncbi:hypothetical protein [Pedobacter sp. FW305-3-2-15-E-R2A2]|uniref:hypothetical protein n=1 Tax=Pedobacter sp. FW305-3-2-15-E-R2A2 TaxID=3140251 RepID=UPI00313FF639
MYADDPPTWLQRAMTFLGISTSRPRSNEEAAEKDAGQERLSRVSANSKQIEKNLDNLPLPLLNGSMKMAKGIVKKDNTAVASGAGSALMDVFGGKIVGAAMGPILSKLAGKGALVLLLLQMK